MKLNLGSGENPLKGFINIDINIWHQGNYQVSDVNKYLMGVKDKTVDEIYAGHFLEHLDDEYLDACLSHCVRVLKDDGVMQITVPDAFYEINALEAGLSDADHAKLVIFGNPHSNEGRDKHSQVFTPRTITKLLLTYFTHVKRIQHCDHWIANVPWQMTYECRK